MQVKDQGWAHDKRGWGGGGRSGRRKDGLLKVTTLGVLFFVMVLAATV